MIICLPDSCKNKINSDKSPYYSEKRESYTYKEGCNKWNYKTFKNSKKHLLTPIPIEKRYQASNSLSRNI